jgi:cyanophycinase
LAATLRRILPLLCTLAVLGSGCTPAESPSPRTAIAEPVVGPANGALIVAGGGQLGPEIMERFVELAGGAEARIVVIPTAGTEENFPDDWRGFQPLHNAGARHVTVLHTRNRAEADLESFVAPLREATGVWIPGGRQWRLVDSYLDTRTHGELFALLDRGGVIGGTSAGASIQASYLVRGDPTTNEVVMAPGYEIGFGFLERVAVDQHLLTRQRQADLLDVVGLHPDLLGIGLDEGTAIYVRGNRAEVIGRSKVAIYNGGDRERHLYYFLEPGDVFDLGQREVVREFAPAF